MVAVPMPLVLAAVRQRERRSLTPDFTESPEVQLIGSRQGYGALAVPQEKQKQG